MAERRDKRMMDENIRVASVRSIPLDSPPSHYCAVCGKMEYPNAVFATSAFWLCDDCIEKLKKLLKEVEK